MTADGDGVAGATVLSETDPARKTTTIATPDDPERGDGLYRLFSPATGQHRFTASKEGYTSDIRTVTLTQGQTANADFDLTKTP